MRRRGPDEPAIGRPPVGAFGVSAVAGAVLVTLLYVASVDVARFGLPALGGGLSLYALAALAAAIGLIRAYPHQTLGLCNLVTLARLVLVAALASALIAAAPPSWTIFALALLALMLDGVDGWLARRQGLVSAFGARFDMEVDAAFALVLALLAVTNGIAPLAVVALGLPHYVFLAAKRLLPWLGGPLPDRFSRKAVCVAQIGTLVALQLPILSYGSLDPLIGLVALALLWSFGRDIHWLWRARP